MKNPVKLAIMGISIIVAFSLGSKTPTLAQTAEKESLKSFEGTYLGFSPTDESDIAFGEIEITINGKDIKVRMATGLKIREEKMNIADFVPMTTQEVKEIFRDGSQHPARTVGFKNKKGFPKLLFLKEPVENEFGLIVRTGGMGEILGPTILYSPFQIARGDYEKAIQNIEQRAEKGIIPRLSNGGKAKKNKLH